MARLMAASTEQLTIPLTGSSVGIIPSLNERVQVFTPVPVARFMAELLLEDDPENVNLLDPGAGTGVLAESVAATFGGPLSVTMVEIDPILATDLRHMAAESSAFSRSDEPTVIEENFLTFAKNPNLRNSFSRIISNPPYARITKADLSRALVRDLEIRSSNLYGAFLWKCVDLLSPGGRMVAIVPRSFCNGLQFRPLRDHMFHNGSLFRVHHFTNRNSVFGRDSVQQEVVIIGFVKSISPLNVQVTRSTGIDDLEQTSSTVFPRTRIIEDEKNDYVIRIPSADSVPEILASKGPLLPKGVDVSVGSVVDFRVSQYLRTEVEDGAVPLIGSEQFSSKLKSERWLKVSAETEKYVYPPGKYVIVRRLSPPEQNPRLQAIIVNSDNPLGVTFENHILVIHSAGFPLTQDVAAETVARLTSSTTVQQIVERTGSTQINVRDVRALQNLVDVRPQ